MLYIFATIKKLRKINAGGDGDNHWTLELCLCSNQWGTESGNPGSLVGMCKGEEGNSGAEAFNLLYLKPLQNDLRVGLLCFESLFLKKVNENSPSSVWLSKVGSAGVLKVELGKRMGSRLWIFKIMGHWLTVPPTQVENQWGNLYKNNKITILILVIYLLILY